MLLGLTKVTDDNYSPVLGSQLIGFEYETDWRFISHTNPLYGQEVGKSDFDRWLHKKFMIGRPLRLGICLTFFEIVTSKHFSLHQQDVPCRIAPPFMPIQLLGKIAWQFLQVQWSDGSSCVICNFLVSGLWLV